MRPKSAGGFQIGVNMADFDAILRKALASRAGAPGDERRKIYERARQALVRQLTGFEPPLPPEDISRQRLALEGAIRKVEAEVASNGGYLKGAEPSAATSTSTSASPTPPPAARPPAAPIPPRAPVAQQPAARPAATPVSATPPSQPVRAPVTPAPTAPATPAPAASPVSAAPAPTSSPAVSPEPAPSFAAQAEPSLDDMPSVADSKLPEFDEAAAVAAPEKKRGNAAGLIVGLVALVLVAAGSVAAWQLGLLDDFIAGNDQEVATLEAEVLEEAPNVRTVGDDPTRSSERLLPDNQGTEENVPDAASEESPTAAPDQAATGLPVAQSAILYEEGLTPDADGFTAPGRALWTLDTSTESPAIVGAIDVPARGLSIGMRITRNLDDALPATHLIEFSFDLAEPFPADGIAELVGVVVKPQEQAGGDPLRGAIVDLGEGVFWQALAAGEADQVVNIPLLRDGRWFDLPVLYSDNRRAIITFEKGENGVAIFQQALSAWGN